MHLKNLFSILFTLWHFAVFNTFFINQSFGSAELIKRDLSFDRSNMPKNILATSMIGGSHLPQMLEIMKILVDRGYNVTLIAPKNYTARSSNYRSIPQIIFDNEYFNKLLNTSINEAFIDNNQAKLFRLISEITINSYEPYYNIYKKTAEEINVDLFFCDYLMNHPCYDLAWQLGKPAVGISSDLSFISKTAYKSDPSFGPECHVSMENESFYNRFKCAIIMPLVQYWGSIDFLKELNAQRAKLGVEPYWGMRVSNLLHLSNNFFGFEIPNADTPLHQEIGPVMPDSFPSLTPVLESFLVNHPRTIYFALGTNAIISPKQINIILSSFLKLIDQNVIDGVIWSTARTDTSNSLKLANYSTSLITILNNEHPHIHISKFSPQFAILSHENTKLFLSHGGAASSHESMYTATPMLVLPMFGDQPRNAEKLEMAGIGLKISKADLSVDDIVSKVKRLLNKESFKKNAERLQFLTKVNSKRKYRAADLIEIVMNTVKYEGIKDENGGFKVNNEKLLRDWITPDTRMGFIKGNYLDIYSFTFILFLALNGGFIYTLFKIGSYFYIKYSNESRRFQKSLKAKKA